MNPEAAADLAAAGADRPVPRRQDFHFRLGEDTPLPATTRRRSRDARHFRDVLGRFCTGVTVVTSMSNGEPVGMTCQSFSSVSLSPPLVLFCPAKTSRAWPLMQRAGHFCVNLLADGQDELSNAMATKGADKFDGVGWSPVQDRRAADRRRPRLRRLHDPGGARGRRPLRRHRQGAGPRVRRRRGAAAVLPGPVRPTQPPTRHSCGLGPSLGAVPAPAPTLAAPRSGRRPRSRRPAGAPPVISSSSPDQKQPGS